MDIVFTILSMLCGLALFMYGMRVMGQGLEKVAGGKFEKTLEKMTNNPVKGVLLGAAVTAVIQSSSATTVMVVGFVNSGIMKLGQAVGVIMGANIGTTVTSWLLSLTGIESNSFWINMLKPSSFSPILAVIGISMLMFSKKGKAKDIGSILIGFTVLMTGMSTMSAAVAPLSEVPEFTRILTLFQNPIVGVLAGAVLTAIIQSSSASVGILQSLSSSQAITYGAAIPIIMGQNIGTCVTALLSCVGANKNAKRTAMIHLYFNLIGTILFLGIYYIAYAVFHFAFVDDAISMWGIAVVHTAFNIMSTLFILPFSKALEKLAVITIREKEVAVKEEIFLDERLLVTPSIAVEHCRKTIMRMADESKIAIDIAIQNMSGYKQELADEVKKYEDRGDVFEDKIGNYLVKLSSRSLNMDDSRTVSMLLHAIGDLERITDHAQNIVEVSKEMHDKGISFSEDAINELKVISNAILEITGISVKAFDERNDTLAKDVEPLEQVVDNLRDSLRRRHIDRLQKGNCTIELGFIFSDLLTNYERVSDHCSNLAVLIIDLAQSNDLDSHKYLSDIKKSVNSDFSREFTKYSEKYMLP